MKALIASAGAVDVLLPPAGVNDPAVVGHDTGPAAALHLRGGAVQVSPSEHPC